MAKKESAPIPAQHADEHDHSHPMLPLILISLLGIAILALALRAFGIL